MKNKVYLLLFGIALLGGCSTTAPVDNPGPSEVRTHEDLYAVLWTQTAAEYRAVTMQAYATARRMLDRALADSSWSAATEQHGRFSQLPPAVLLDIDETVLDNSPYQARRILANGAYTRDSWNDWVAEASARPIPGAVGFTRYAASKGVAVIFVSNRRASNEEATRRNLERAGFPIAREFDSVLLRGEQPAWQSSDKTPRRQDVATKFRIVMQVGDNLGDFLGDVDRTPSQRATMAEPFDSFWGERWIALPNPQYGSWQSALFDFDFSLDRKEQLERAYHQLQTN